MALLRSLANLIASERGEIPAEPEAEQPVEIELLGYTTEVAMAAIGIKPPCDAHRNPGWTVEIAKRAHREGWPVDGVEGSGHQADCPDCQATPVELHELVLGYTTTDPRVVGVNERGEAIDHRGLNPNEPGDQA